MSNKKKYTMVDFLGNSVVVGDTVISGGTKYYRGQSQLVESRVIKVTDKMVLLKSVILPQHGWVEFRKYHNQVILKEKNPLKSKPQDVVKRFLDAVAEV